MSAFLGPIHGIVYDKIKAEEVKVQHMVAKMQDTRVSAVVEELPAPVIGTLEDVIDLNNIHGWLSEQVQGVDARYAAVVGAVRDAKGDAGIHALLPIEQRFGETAAQELPQDMELAQAFMQLRHKMLDGMPCDGGLVQETEGDTEIHFRINPNAHPAIVHQGLEDVFYLLRESWLQGFAKTLGLEAAHVQDNQFVLRKKNA